jgi:cellulose synthase/poly-beta-1,6-N-acetylglucosamine synthase-like glycosyltransferase
LSYFHFFSKKKLTFWENINMVPIFFWIGINIYIFFLHFGSELDKNVIWILHLELIWAYILDFFPKMWEIVPRNVKKWILLDLGLHFFLNVIWILHFGADFGLHLRFFGRKCTFCKETHSKSYILELILVYICVFFGENVHLQRTHSKSYIFELIVGLHLKM